MVGKATDAAYTAMTDLVGIPFASLAGGRPLNPRNYQLARQIVADAAMRVLPATGLGRCVWVTVPIDPLDGAPREPTPIHSPLDFSAAMAHSFEQSSLASRLREVLLVPIVKPDVDEPGQWWVSLPAVWEPSPDEWARLEKDYDLIREAIADGRHGDLSSGRDWAGQIVVPKTNGANARDTHKYVDASGRTHEAKKYGYYIRPDVIARLLSDPPRTKEALESERRERLLAAFSELDELDARYTRASRREQALLRNLLPGGGRRGACALCGRRFPTELLVAAHIKPRSRCSGAEKRDMPANAMLACKFGCDELFERGWLTVDAMGVVKALEGLSGTVGKYLAGMEGRRVRDAWPRGDTYFRWHRDHVWVGRGL